ncbi:CASP C terminal-domain-containing protein [Coemansia spiralis]|nr:CASP C terminal-domain-containing protein [Coemansia spiralis]
MGALEYWRTLQLSHLLPTLDETSLSIIDNQKTTLSERRKLAEQTKEFRALAAEEKLSEFKSLLRMYQNEIDSLTKRMKFAENAFLTLFKKLGDAPDPEPLLGELTSVRRQNEQLSSTVEALLDENQKLRDAEKQRGAELEAMVDRLAREKAAEVERDMREQTGELVHHLKERERDLQRQLSMATQQLMPSDPVESDHGLVARLAELEIMAADLDHANAQLADARALNSRLKAENKCASDPRVSELELEVHTAFGRLEQAEAELRQRTLEHQTELSLAEDSARAQRMELQRLRAELHRCADYDEVKRELDVIKSVEFNTGWDDAAGLEELLVRRNKELENKLVGTKTELAAAEQTAEQMAARAGELEAELTAKASLAAKLETELLSIDQPAHHGLTDIIAGQRDRFRQRNIELEDELRVHAATVDELRRRAEQSRQDNLRLFEEVKYLRSRVGDSVQSKFSSHSADVRHMYEASLNPFNEFHRRETSRRVRSMGIFDRLVYIVGNFVVSHRRARMLVILYITMLHLLVMVTLYYRVQADPDASQ